MIIDAVLLKPLSKLNAPSVAVSFLIGGTATAIGGAFNLDKGV